MHEQEWLTCDDSIRMLHFLLVARSGRRDSTEDATNEAVCALVSDRKLRLFACACVRRCRVLGGGFRQRAVEVCERYADGQASRAELENALVLAQELPEPIASDADFALSVFGPTDMAWEAKLSSVFATLGPELDVVACAAKVTEVITQVEGAEYLEKRGRTERSQQAHLLRDIFGNPFRPATLDHSRLSAETRRLAQSIYEKGEFTLIPQLGRGLAKDEVCTSRDVLDHCEWPVRHVRGCWVVDRVLGKS